MVYIVLGAVLVVLGIVSGGTAMVLLRKYFGN